MKKTEIKVKIFKNLNMVLSFNYGDANNNGERFFVSVNGKEWLSVNPYNFKADPQFEIDWITNELRGGAYKFFI